MQFNFTRRQFVGGSLGGLFAFAARHGQDSLFAAEAAKTTKRCIVLWMGGGPSQIDTFDPKPGTATGGPTQAIATPVPGLSISGYLPEVAKRFDQLSVIQISVNITSAPSPATTKAAYRRFRRNSCITIPLIEITTSNSPEISMSHFHEEPAWRPL